MKKNPAKTNVDWERYENIPFAVLIHSTEMGWIEAARPALGEEWKRYEDFDGKKMLLNYGMLLAETE